ncbi:twin-arginine translocase subunit TatC [Archaeoglobus sp.]
MSNPPEDKELEITEHIAELRKRVLRICIAMISSISVMFYISYSPLLNFWYTLVGNRPLYVFSPIEWVVIRLTFSTLLSLVILYPYIIYELYLFAKPGLYEHERKFLRAILLPSYLIFIFGFFFAYEFAIPFLYKLALTNSAEPYLSAERTITNAFKLLFTFGIFFQIPLAMVLADRFKIVDYKTFKSFRIPVYIIILLLVTNLTMDFTGLTQFASLALFVAMYELGLLMLRIFQKSE